MSETTDVRVELVAGMAFRGVDQHGLQIAMDASAAVGGQGHGPKPIDVLAMALGGCTGMDVISMLRKMRQDVTAYTVRVTGPRAETHPQVFTALTVAHLVAGNDLDEQQVRRAVTLSATRYCPASGMLSHVVPITHRYCITTAAGEETACGDIDVPAQVGR